MTGDRPECHLVCIPPDKAARVWPLARDLIFAAMKRGDLSSFGPVEDRVLRGDALLWLALTCEGGGRLGIDAAAVTELHRAKTGEGPHDRPARRISAHHLAARAR